MKDEILHATKRFERLCASSVEEVFTAFADPAIRLSWGAPSEKTGFLYERTEFREGGQDIFLCGNKLKPEYRGITTYLSIKHAEHIISSEVVDLDGRTLLVTLSTTIFESHGQTTKVTVTAQLTSLVGDTMLQGADKGHHASLDNLMKLWKP